VSEWDANGEALSQNTTVLIANVGTASNSATSTSHDFLSTSAAPTWPTTTPGGRGFRCTPSLILKFDVAGGFAYTLAT
jgi:hypothetical protein